MLYKHQFFTLDAVKNKVFDENGKELRISGNAYRVLEYLARNKAATLTEIGGFLDWAKDYTENHLRQYRYKINTIIGYDVVDYSNGKYSIVGNIEETDHNTDLLQREIVESGHMKKEIKFVKWPAILVAIALLLAILPWPYGYFTLLRFLVAAAAVYYAYYLYAVLEKTEFWFWSLVFIALLFNPVIPVHLGEKSVWSVIDIITAVYFGIFIFRFRFQV